MILLRLLSVLAAGIVFILVPVVLDPTGHGLPGLTALSGLAAVSLAAGAFLYFAAVAPRLQRHPEKRLVVGLLLLVPCLGAGTMLFTQKEPLALWSSGLLLAATLLLMLGVLVPEALGSSRRLRRREAGPAVLGRS